MYELIREHINVIAPFIFIILALGAIFYILSSIGLSRIARKMGHPKPYYAWIPFARTYLFAELGKGEIIRVKGIKASAFYENLGLWMVFLPIISSFLRIIPIFGDLVSLVVSVFMIYLDIIIAYHIFKFFVGIDSAAGYVVLYFFLSAIALFVIGNKELLSNRGLYRAYESNSDNNIT